MGCKFLDSFCSWTFDRAVEYLLNNTLLSRDQCEGQIKRYVKWPGHSCSYKIGELKIKELRAKAEKQLGMCIYNPDLIFYLFKRLCCLRTCQGSTAKKSSTIILQTTKIKS